MTSRLALSSEAVLALSIIIGIVVAPASRLLAPWLYEFVFLLMVFSLLTIDLRHALPDAAASGRLARMLGWQMLALPVAVGLWHRFSPAAGDWSLLVLITACAGTIFGAPAFARVMRLDTLVTLQGVLTGTLLMPLVLPIAVALFSPGSGSFDLSAYAWRLCLFIVIPLAIAAVYQRLHPGERPLERRWFGTLTIVFLALFGVAVMDGIGARFVAAPGEMLGLLGFATGVHVAFFGFGFALFLRWGRRAALTAGLLSAYRNMALMLAVGGELLPPDFVVYVALWQIPMFLAPVAVRRLRPAPT